MVVVMYIILLMQFWISGSFTVLTISGVTCTRQLKKQVKLIYVEVESGCSYPWLSVVCITLDISPSVSVPSLLPPSLSGELLTKAWGTDLLADSNFFLMMVMIRLPEGVVPADILPPCEEGEGPVYAYKHAVAVQNSLHHNFKIEVGCSEC